MKRMDDADDDRHGGCSSIFSRAVRMVGKSVMKISTAAFPNDGVAAVTNTGAAANVAGHSLKQSSSGVARTKTHDPGMQSSSGVVRTKTHDPGMQSSSGVVRTKTHDQGMQKPSSGVVRTKTHI